MSNLDLINADRLIKEFGSPLYVYDENKIREQIKKLKEHIVYPNKQILYACKANSNIAIMKILKEEGAWLDAMSPGELEIGFRAGFNSDEILYTGDNVTDEEMIFCIDRGIQLNLGSLSQIERYARINPNSSISIRINPDCGAGHHSHTITGGPNSKFGIYFDRVGNIKSLAKKYGINITGVHSHIGSGILEVDEFIKAIDVTLNVAKHFDNLEFIDFGGGLGIPYSSSDKELNMADFGSRVSDRFVKFCRDYGKDLSLYLEPGRFLVAESGILLITVNNLKETPSHRFAGTDSGFHHLMRPMAYGSYHEIINLSSSSSEIERICVTGNLCESGDIFTQSENGFEDRPISKVKEGDILAILNTGAYGFSMSSNYNSRPRPAEVLISNNGHRLIRKRETINDIIRPMDV